MRPTLVLDLDGTLVDTVPDLRASLDRLMAARNLAPFAADAVTRMVGDGVGVLVQRAMRARGRDSTPADVADFLSDYGSRAAEASRPYPGIIEGLARLQAEGWRLAVCTNKPEAPSRTLLDALGILAPFDAIGGGDSFAVRKPDPAHLLLTVAAAGGDPANAVMVGDHRNDIAAASAAGIPSIFARWGYGTPEMAAGATAHADGFAEIPARAADLLKVPPRTSSHPRTTASGN